MSNNATLDFTDEIVFAKKPRSSRAKAACELANQGYASVHKTYLDIVTFHFSSNLSCHCEERSDKAVSKM
jgi:hypothetical protein